MNKQLKILTDNKCIAMIGEPTIDTVRHQGLTSNIFREAPHQPERAHGQTGEDRHPLGDMLGALKLLKRALFENYLASLKR